MPSAPHSAPLPGGGPPRRGHRHTTSCYWDVLACGWYCPPTGGAPVAAPSAVDAVGAPEPAAPVAGAAPV
jgi:hypothetical protein